MTVNLDEKAELASYIADRGINRLIHFSPRRNLIGMFKFGGLWSRSRLIEYAKQHNDEDVLAYVTWNDSIRLDGRQDCINLSIERINYFLFDVFRRKFEERFGDDEPWCAIEIDPSVMLQPGVLFARANAASAAVRANGIGSGLAGLQALFADKIVTPKYNNRVQIDNRTHDCPICCPTSVQAEVLVPNEISLSKFMGIVFMSREDMVQVKSMLKTLFPSVRLPSMRVSMEEFRGVGNR